LAVSARGHDVWQLYDPAPSVWEEASIVDACLGQESVLLLSKGAQPRLFWSRFWDGDAPAGADPYHGEWLRPIQPASVAMGAGRIVVVGREGKILSRAIANQPAHYMDVRPWDYQSSGTACDLKRVRFINGRFVAIGERFADGQNAAGDRNDILTSLDGITWTRHRFSAAALGGQTEDMLDILYQSGGTPGTGSWLVGINRAGRFLRFSENFSSVTRVNVAGLGIGQQVCFGSGVYVIASETGLFRSVDGMTFSPVLAESSYKLAHDGTRFVAFMHYYGPGSIWHSTDGLGWTEASSVPSLEALTTWLIGCQGLWLAGSAQRGLSSKPSGLPQITAQPAPFTLLHQGGSVTLSVTVAEAPNTSFAWYRGSEGFWEQVKEGSAISGTDTASLTLSSVTLSEADDYLVKVYNPAGLVNSAVARVAVRVLGQGAALTLNDNTPPSVGTGSPVTSPNGVFRVEGRWRYEQHGEEVTSVLLEDSEGSVVWSVANDGTCAGLKTFSDDHEKAAVWGTAGTMRFVEDIMRDDYALQIGARRLRGAGISADGLTLHGVGWDYESYDFVFQWSLSLEAPLTEAAPTPRLVLESSAAEVDPSPIVRNDELQEGTPAYGMPVMSYEDETRSITFTLRNEGRKDLNVSSIMLVGPQRDFFSLNAPAQPFVLGPAQTQVVQVVYGAATSARGAHAAVFRIACDDPVKPVHAAQVQGSRGNDAAEDRPYSLSVKEGTRRLSAEAGVDFGVTNPGVNLSRTLSIQNIASALYHGEDLVYSNVEFSIVGAQAGSFSLEPASIGKLLFNQKVSRVIRFQPVTTGVHFAWLKIEFEVGPQWIPLSGLVQAGGPPVIVGLLPSQIINGNKLTSYEPLSWARSFGVHVVSGSLPMKYQWWKNGVRIAGATGTSLAFSKMKPSDAGSYSFSATNAQGQTTHTPVSHIAVFAPEPFGFIVEGKPFEWNIPHGKPPGGTLGFLWSNSGNQPWPASYSGMTTSRLRTEKAVFPLPDDNIICDLTFITPNGQTLKRRYLLDDSLYATPSRWPGRIRLPVALVGSPVTADLPRFDPITAPEFEPHEHQVTFSATGLPPGIVLNGKTGRLTGTPTAARVVKGIVEPYEVKITARCTFPAATETQTVQWMIRPLPMEMTGSFEGVTNDCLVLLDILPTGKFSGSVNVGGKKFPFNGKLAPALNAEGDLTIAPVTLSPPGTKLPEGFPPLGLTYSVPGIMPVSFWNAAFSGLPPEQGNRGKLFRCLVSSRLPYTGPRGPLNVGLLKPEPQWPYYYMGSGFATLRISTAGAGTWAGTLTDGQTFTSSQRVVSMPAYDAGSDSWSPALGVALYSYQAARRLLAPAALLKPDGKIEGSDGLFTSDTARSSIAGPFRLLGAPYVAPAKGMMWPGFANSAANARLSLSVAEADLLDRNFIFDLSPTGAVKLPVFGATEPKFSITVTPASGRVSGTVTVSTPDLDSPPGQNRRLTSSGPFSGLFIPHPDINKVMGHVNLPEYPISEAPANKTPIRSGPMELKPALTP
jgi:hypothetical protein